MKKSHQKSKNTTVLFYSYETITLKLYLEIVRTLDLKKLIVAGVADQAQCQQVWDKIMERCAEVNGGLDYVGYIDLSQRQGYLLKEYNIIKAWLIKLWFVVDDEIIGNLIDRGYNIITTKENPKYNHNVSLSENYKRSLIDALQRSENLVTKIKMTANEIKEMFEGKQGGRQDIMFDEIMAFLLVRGIKVEDSITLSRYNELVKILRKTSKPENVYG